MLVYHYTWYYAPGNSWEGGITLYIPIIPLQEEEIKPLKQIHYIFKEMESLNSLLQNYCGGYIIKF